MAGVEKEKVRGYLTMTKNVIPYLHLWCSLYRDPSGGGGGGGGPDLK